VFALYVVLLVCVDCQLRLSLSLEFVHCCLELVEDVLFRIQLRFMVGKQFSDDVLLGVDLLVF